MTISLGLGVFTPIASLYSGGPLNNVFCYGTSPRGVVSQVLNLVTGADVSSSFDPYLRNDGSIVQLDTTPSSTTPHLIVFRQSGEDEPGVYFCVMQSSLAYGAHPGPVTATGVQPGDVVLRAFQPVSNFTGGTYSAEDVTGYFFPSSPAAGTVTQMRWWASAASDATLLMMLKQGQSPPNFDICVVSMGPLGIAGGASGTSNNPPPPFGSTIVGALDLTNVADASAVLTSPLIAVNGDAFMTRYAINGNVLLLIDMSTA